jgi:hypothetical protein
LNKDKVSICKSFILGISIIISALILGNSLKSLTNQDNIINGSLGVNGSLMVSQGVNSESEYMAIGEVSSLLGYDSIGVFKKDVLNNKIGYLPYVSINGELIFSRTAFEDWLEETARQRKIYNN